MHYGLQPASFTRVRENGQTRVKEKLFINKFSIKKNEFSIKTHSNCEIEPSNTAGSGKSG